MAEPIKIRNLDDLQKITKTEVCPHFRGDKKRKTNKKKIIRIKPIRNNYYNFRYSIS